MPKLRRISGDDLIAILTNQGFKVVRQKGSHVRLVCLVNSSYIFITVPLHHELDRGTLRSIIRSLQKCLSGEIIKKLFY